jgi:hypothetical protein
LKVDFFVVAFCEKPASTISYTGGDAFGVVIVIHAHREEWSREIRLRPQEIAGAR